jgi:hypothetical protein
VAVVVVVVVVGVIIPSSRENKPFLGSSEKTICK